MEIRKTTLGLAILNGHLMLGGLFLFAASGWIEALWPKILVGGLLAVGSAAWCLDLFRWLKTESQQAALLHLMIRPALSGFFLGCALIGWNPEELPFSFSGIMLLCAIGCAVFAGPISRLLARRTVTDGRTVAGE